MNLLLIRLIIFAVLLWAGLKLYRMYREWKLEQDAPRRVEDAKMVRCAYCRVHLPEQDAVRRDQLWFCSSNHHARFLEEQTPS